MRIGLRCRALWLLVRYELLLRRGRLPGIHRRLRACAVTGAEPDSTVEEHAVAAIATACQWYPRHVACLQRAAATVELMRHVGVPAELVIGAAKQPLGFHAWVEVGGRAINEKRETQLRYAVLERC